MRTRQQVGSGRVLLRFAISAVEVELELVEFNLTRAEFSGLDACQTRNDDIATTVAHVLGTTSLPLPILDRLANAGFGHAPNSFDS